MSDQAQPTEETTMTAPTTEAPAESGRLDVRAILARIPAAARAAAEALGESEEGIEARETPAEAAARKRDRALAWRNRLPAMYADATLDSLDECQQPARLRAWHESTHRNLVLRSETVGNGKTYAAYALGTAACDAGQWAVAWSMADLNAALRPTEGEPQAWRVATACDVLVIDDLGREKMTDWTLEQLLRLLDLRGREHRRTIVTTNLAGELVAERYGAPVVSRIVDDAWVIEFTGQMRRAPAPW
jgi:DNA replication protein DnaC